jgi:hypothetical protein
VVTIVLEELSSSSIVTGDENGGNAGLLRDALEI